MADATGTPTTNYSFKTIDGEDTAGYTSINSVITSIDTQLQDLAVKDNSMILVDVPSAATPASYMSGYTIASSALSATQYGTYMGLNAPTGAYYWYKKS
jgi:hypothetical protein